MLEGYYVKKVGQNRGKPRIWLEGTQTERAGFKPGQRFDITVDGRTVVLQANPDGSRVVSSKRIGERDNPVIDINSEKLLAVFDGMAAIRVVVKKDQIYLLPLASELKKQERFLRLKESLEKEEPLMMGSLSHGGGVLSHAIHTGLQQAGIKSQLAFANEIRPELLEHAAEHNDIWSDETKVLAAPMQELAFDDRGLAHIPKLHGLEIALPCSGASRAGRSKRGLEHPEAHPDVGHLVVSALVIINKTNPAVVLLENVPEYAVSASADILRNQLRDMGYKTHERILNGKEWGTLENRNRWCCVAVTEGLNFDFDQLIPPAPNERRIVDVIDSSIGPDDQNWRTFDYLKTKEIRDAEKGNSFAMQIVSPSDDKVPTLRKGYQKGGSTDPLLQHPDNPDLLRQFTVAEHARIKEVPEHLVHGLSNTVGHELLGQGIVYPPFRDVGAHIGNALNRFAGRPEVPLPGRDDTFVAPEARATFAIDVVDEVVKAAQALGVEVSREKVHDSLITGHGPERGVYLGKVLGINEQLGLAFQDTGQGQGMVLPESALSRKLSVGEMAHVRFERGRGTVVERTLSVGRGRG